MSGKLKRRFCTAEVTSASYNIGVFLCDQCAGVHVGLGAHISKTKHLKMGRWEDSQVPTYSVDVIIIME